RRRRCNRWGCQAGVHAGQRAPRTRSIWLRAGPGAAGREDYVRSPAGATQRPLRSGPGSILAYLRGLSAAISCLDRRARHRAVGAEHAAVARLGLEPLAASFAVIEKLASIRGHSLNRLMLAFGAGDRRLHDHRTPRRASA